jgi:hypothetical protein
MTDEKTRYLRAHLRSAMAHLESAKSLVCEEIKDLGPEATSTEFYHMSTEVVNAATHCHAAQAKNEALS